MILSTEVQNLAASVEARLMAAGALDPREARLCAVGLALVRDNARLIEVAELIGSALRLPWDDPRVMRAAARTKLLFDSDLGA